MMAMVTRQANDAHYAASLKGKARSARYAATPKGRAKNARYWGTQKGIEARFKAEMKRMAKQLARHEREYEEATL